MNAGLLVFIGGGLGSLLRYLIAKFSLQLYPSDFPLGTVIANVISCTILALILVYFHQKPAIDMKSFNLLIVSGFCGGLSTFSTFSFETMELFRNQMWGIAFFNIGLSLLLGIGLIYVITLKGN